MQFIRTLIWALFTGVLVAFVAINWAPVRINVWPDSSDYQGYIHLQGPLGLLILLIFALGWLPTWLIGIAGRWRLRRRLATLENAVRVHPAESVSPPPAAPPLSTPSPLAPHGPAPVETDPLG